MDHDLRQKAQRAMEGLVLGEADGITQLCSLQDLRALRSRYVRQQMRAAVLRMGSVLALAVRGMRAALRLPQQPVRGREQETAH